MSDRVTEYFNGSFLPSDVWKEKYQLTTIDGEPKEETPEDMHKRMAEHFGRIEESYRSERTSVLKNKPELLSEYGRSRDELYEDKVFELFDEFEYIVPQGSIMSMLGNPYQTGSLSNCVVIPDVKDSYGAIMYSDQQLAQLMKRRCVHEDSFVLTEDNGFVQISDLEEGDYILSKGETENEYNRVTDKFIGDNQKDKYQITLQSGTTLNLLEDHRVYLPREDQYVKADELSEGDVTKVSSFDYDLTDFDDNLSDTGWFIGCHIGDGSVDKKTKKYQGPRFRVTGQNKNVVAEYGSILNNFVDSNRKTFEPAEREHYESEVYKYTQTVKETKTVLNKYLDGQRGSKVSEAFVPSYISENNLYLPFIGGLIDSDGWIKDNGSAICIRICAKEVVDEIAQILRSSGFSINVSERPVKEREDHFIQGRNDQYEVYIRGSSRFWKEIAPFIKHPDKKEMVENANITIHSRKYFITSEWKNKILSRYESLEWGEGNNQLAAVIYILRKKGELADSGLNTLLENEIIGEKELQEIRSHRKVKNIKKVDNDDEYYDLTVEENHNFYTGNFGLCLTHNCGVGVDVSRLRPEGASVRNAARSSTGAVSFMHRFSDTTNEVAQDGRRGALMLTLDCRHPDMTRFVEEKDDPTAMTGANISAKWTDDFLEAVENDESYTLRFPVDADPKDAEITKKVNARELFRTASENAHIHGGDPGCMYIDRMEDYSTDCGYPNIRVSSTNPCVTGDTLIPTDQGLVEASVLAEKGSQKIITDERIDHSEKYRETTGLGVYKTGVKDVYKVETEEGYTLRLTKNHKVKTDDEWVEIQNLEVNDEVHIRKQIGGFGNQGSEEKGRVLGWLVGDGFTSDGTAYLDFYTDEMYLGESFADDVDQIVRSSDSNREYKANARKVSEDQVRIGSNRLYEIAEKEELDQNKLQVPCSVKTGNKNIQRGFLRSLFSADGSVQGSIEKGISVRLASKSHTLLSETQQILLNFGIFSVIYHDRKPAQSKLLPNQKGGYSEYYTEGFHELVISKNDLIRFRDRIGFLLDRKQEELESILTEYEKGPYSRSFTATVKNIEKDGKEEVFDLTEPVTRSFTADGFVVHNCGEIGMWGGPDSCRLIAMNLMSVVENPFTDEASIDYDLLYKISYEQQRLLDNLVDLEIEAIDRIIEKVKNDPEADKYKRIEIETWESLKECGEKYRRTGAGFTALGDMLAAIGVEYGSEECDEVLHEVMSTKLEGEWDASTDLAIERGTFPEWDSQYDDTEFFDMLKDEFSDIYGRNMEHGRRNISLSTVAPTGSVSLMSKIGEDFGTTSGIEPLFSTEENKAWHTRNKRADGSEDYDYVDEEGNKWKQYPVFHNGFRIWMEENGYEDPTEKPEDELKEIFKESPYVTSAGLHWKDRLRTQGIVQKYISHSISSCITAENHLVHTSEGLKYIEDIGPENDGFADTYSEGIDTINHRDEESEISQFYYNGKAQTIEVRLEGGSTIEGTKDHRVKVLEGDYVPVWKTLGSIEEGDRVVGRTGLECFGDPQRTITDIMGEPFKTDVDEESAKDVQIPRRVSRDLARILGYLTSDGHVNENGFGLTQLRNNVVDDFIEKVKNTFGLEQCTIREEHRTDSELISINFHSRVLRDFFEYLGVKRSTCEKTVPKIIFEGAGRLQTKEYIKGLTLDGYVSDDKIGIMTTCSKKLADEIKALLDQYGIQAGVVTAAEEGERIFPNSSSPYETQKSWVVHCDPTNAEVFKNYIGFAENRKIEEMSDKLGYPQRKWQGSHVPDLALREFINDNYRDTFKSDKLNCYIRKFSAPERHGMSINRDNLFYLHDIGIDIPDILLDKTYTFRKVTDKSYSEEKKKTYDLHVRNGNSYTVNGILSHNTLNLPEDADAEETYKIYKNGRKYGLKGATIFRNGSKRGVLEGENNGSSDESHVTYHDAPERPEVLEADIHQVRYNGEPWKILVGRLEGKPYEVFAIKTGKDTGIRVRFTDSDDNKIEEGLIRKTDSGVYNFEAKDGKVVIEDIAEYAPDDNVRVDTRLLSLNLRHGVKPEYLVSQLEKADGSVVSFGRAILKALRSYLDVDPDDKCPECGEESLAFVESCLKCKNCSYSRC